MPETLPRWLADALPEARSGHALLAAARLGGDGLLGKGGFSLSSAAFADTMALDPSFTADEEDAVAPPVEWTAPPAGAEELVLIVEDTDASRDGQGDQPSCHWLVWGLAPQHGQILEGETPPKTGKNAHGNSEWLLPDPPVGDGPHAYVFQLFALDRALTLAPGASRAELLAEMEGHVLSIALLTGLYGREPGGLQSEDFDADE